MVDLTQYPKVVKFLHTQRLTSIATISSEEPKPEVAWVYYYLGDDMKIYFNTEKNSRKIKNISANSKIALLIAQEVEPAVLQIEGTAHIMHEFEQKAEALKHLATVANANPRSLTWPPPMILQMKEGYEFVAVTIDHFKFSDFSSNTSDIVSA